MPAAPKPPNEVPRYSALMGYHLRRSVLGDFEADQLVRRAVQQFHVPQAAIALVGSSAVYFVAEHGVGFHTIPRDISFCAYAIHTPQLLAVPDATNDPRFADNPLVLNHPHVRFYAGAPLIDRSGYCLGTFCIVDVTPRMLLPDEAIDLEKLSVQAMQRVDFLSTILELLGEPTDALLT
jgi:GAF domain-containing protein